MRNYLNTMQVAQWGKEHADGLQFLKDGTKMYYIFYNGERKGHILKNSSGRKTIDKGLCSLTNPKIKVWWTVVIDGQPSLRYDSDKDAKTYVKQHFAENI